MNLYKEMKEEKLKKECTFEPVVNARNAQESRYWELNMDLIKSKQGYQDFIINRSSDSQ